MNFQALRAREMRASSGELLIAPDSVAAGNGGAGTVIRARSGPALGATTARGDGPCPAPHATKYKNKKGVDQIPGQPPLYEKCSGGVLLSHEASLAVPSALKSLTSGFGMGPGVSPSL